MFNPKTTMLYLLDFVNTGDGLHIKKYWFINYSYVLRDDNDDVNITTYTNAKLVYLADWL